jgi:hypothetical protein
MELLIDNRAKKIYQEYKNGMKKLMEQLVSTFKDSPAGQDFIRQYAKRDHSDENKYFQDFLNRSKQKVFE